MRIKSAVISLILGLPLQAAGTAALGQAAPPPPSGGFLSQTISRTEVALVYNYIRTESVGYTPGVFSLSGVSAAAAYQLRWPHWSAVLDFSGTHVNGVENSGESLTLLISQVGGRYTLRARYRITPFAQVLAGEVHATGTLYPPNAATGGGADSFTGTAGVGIDYPLGSVVSLRGQADYLYTGLPNGGSGANNRQNDLRIGGGLVFHFGAR
jgi:hypothetical protein